jgi:hypothetical protein
MGASRGRRAITLTSTSIRTTAAVEETAKVQKSSMKILSSPDQTNCFGGTTGI